MTGFVHRCIGGFVHRWSGSPPAASGLQLAAQGAVPGPMIQ